MALLTCSMLALLSSMATALVLAALARSSRFAMLSRPLAVLVSRVLPLRSTASVASAMACCQPISASICPATVLP